jgi:uncharacterized protein (TIGR03083 family)
MTHVVQFYGDQPAPWRVSSSADEVVAAWFVHRDRFRAVLGELDDEAWTRATRCTEWDVNHLVQHLVSGAQFLGYTLHEANKGVATRLMSGFHSQATPARAARDFEGVARDDLLAQLAEMDRRVEQEIGAWGADGASAAAESPLGNVPAYVSVNHFLYDSWVHERDVLVPAGRHQDTTPEESLVVAAYVLALAGVARPIDEPQQDGLDWLARLTDLDRTFAVHADHDGSSVAVSDDAAADCFVEGRCADIVDFASGRHVDQRPTGDPPALAYLERFAQVLA